MKDEYNFPKMISCGNPDTNRLKRPITIQLSDDVIAYFKEMSVDSDIPYQRLINLYLRYCVSNHRKLDMNWID